MCQKSCTSSSTVYGRVVGKHVEGSGEKGPCVPLQSHRHSAGTHRRMHTVVTHRSDTVRFRDDGGPWVALCAIAAAALASTLRGIEGGEWWVIPL